MCREMEYGYAVYQERSFTKAAQKMFLSQPALSSMVKKAERKIGMPLFDRSTYPLTLTEAGEYYIEQAEKIMRIQRETKEHFARVSHSRELSIRLCGAAIYQAYIFPPIIAAFHSQYPDIDISWVEERTGLVQKLLTDEADMFPEVNNFISQEVDGVAWKDEELLLVVPAGLPVNERMKDCRFTPGEIREGRHKAADAKAVDMAAFQDLEFILMDEENDTCQRAVAICHNAGFVPRIFAMKPAQMLTAYQLAEQVNRATFVSDTLVEHVDKNYKFYLYKLSDPLAARQQVLFFRRGANQPVASRLFREFVVKYQMERDANKT